MKRSICAVWICALLILLTVSACRMQQPDPIGAQPDPTEAAIGDDTVEAIVVSTPVVTPEPLPTVPPTPTPTPEPTIPVTSISITFLGSPLKEFTQRIGADPLQLKAEVYPVEAVTTAKLDWRSSDDSIITVDETGLVTAVGPGWAEVIAECGGVAASCKVWVPNP